MRILNSEYPTILLSVLCFIQFSNFFTLSAAKDEEVNINFKSVIIEGKLIIPQSTGLNSIELFRDSKVKLGTKFGFIRSDGSFLIHNIGPGSYILSITCPKYSFPIVRLDINPRIFKIKARKLDLIRPNDLSHTEDIQYPLRLYPEYEKIYFEKRSELSILSFLQQPMFLMLVVPMALMLVMPKLLNSMDPSSQKDMQDSMQMLQKGKDSVPDIAEMMTSFFGGCTNNSKKNIEENKKLTKRKKA